MNSLLQRAAADLPAGAVAAAVNRSLEENPCLVVTAPPGAGKSTLLPLTILEGLTGNGRIIMLEPRRLAARQIAMRMASLLGETVGETVGYRIRLESRVSARTRVEVLTEGILTRMLVEDPALEGVSVVIFDEFHERSLQTDTALALVREARSLLRPDLRLVLMSATLDAAPLCRELGAAHIHGEGRMFPVEIKRLPEDMSVARAVLQAHWEEEGDILAFLPGEAEIRRTAAELEGALGNTRICPLYGLLSNEEQRAAIAPSLPGERKVVLSTPIAETSLTIEGVRVVVDGGWCRKPVWDARSALSHLETVRISLDMAEQRCGRAGRVAPGVCYRLWSVATERRMQALRQPEILEADLTGMVLDIAAWGSSQPGSLPWITPPPALLVEQAQALLQALGAVDAAGSITPRGRSLAAFPCHPRLANMLQSATTPPLKALAAELAALLEEKDPLNIPEAGLDLRLRAMSSLARAGARQYRSLLRVPPGVEASRDPYEMGVLVASAYPERIARTWGAAGQFMLATGDLVALADADPLAGAEWLAVSSLNRKEGGVGRIFLAAPVDVRDLEPFVTERESLAWRDGSVVAARERRIGTILQESRPFDPGPRALPILCEAVRREGRSLLSFTDEVLHLQRRIATVAAWHPELSLPDVSVDALLASAPSWLPLYAPEARSAAALKRVDLCAVLRGILTYDQWNTVERLAPARVTVPTGSSIALEYRTGAEVPVLRVRLQECFGLVDTPRVDDGRRPVLMELLSPGFKPVQLTTDLASFWSGTYFEVRKELKRRYPRHAWPDNPLDAAPVRGIARKKG